MRLTIPIQASTLRILNGPDATALLDAWIEKEEQGFKEPTGPRLEFTVEYSPNSTPTKVTVELIGGIKKLPSGSYTFHAYLASSPVTIVYSLQPGASGNCGFIEDLD